MLTPDDDDQHDILRAAQEDQRTRALNYYIEYGIRELEEFANGSHEEQRIQDHMLDTYGDPNNKSGVVSPPEGDE